MRDFTKPSPFGQETGGSEKRHSEEANKILAMLVHVDTGFGVDLGLWDAEFLENMRQKTHFSGKEVMRLRDIKDKLVKRGVI